MFPYADFDNSYWTGYFTSRANAKKYIRDGSVNLHATMKLYASKMVDQSATNDTISKLLSAREMMLDTMGVAQHHDGVTGTAKQHVADDYNFRIFNSIEANNKIYASLIDEIVTSQSTVRAASWVWCDSTNGTYLDCPIHNFSASDHIVVAHNPADIDQSYLKLKVQYADYKVYSWSSEQKAFIDITTNAEAICASRLITKGPLVNDCELHVKVRTISGQITILQLKFDPTSDLALKPDAGNIHKINGFQETFIYKKFDDKYGALFDVIKTQSSKTYQIAFDVRSYMSDQGGNNMSGDNCPSGAYIFKPAKDKQDSIRYATLTNINSYTGKFTSEIQLYLANKD